ncbi:MAG: hypothetical protein ACR2LJ_02055 [Acidimicrobiales bacterium]
MLAEKSRFDYRHHADDYVRPLLGARKVRDITPEVILAWQRKLLKGGRVKGGGPLGPNTVRLARAPLAGAMKLALASNVIAVNPIIAAPRPRAPRSIPRHWTPEQAREFVGLMEGDRTYPVWAFLLSSGVAHRRAGVDAGAKVDSQARPSSAMTTATRPSSWGPTVPSPPGRVDLAPGHPAALGAGHPLLRLP